MTDRPATESANFESCRAISGPRPRRRLQNQPSARAIRRTRAVRAYEIRKPIQPNGSDATARKAIAAAVPCPAARPQPVSCRNTFCFFCLNPKQVVHQDNIVEEENVVPADTALPEDLNSVRRSCKADGAVLSAPSATGSTACPDHITGKKRGAAHASLPVRIKKRAPRGAFP